MDIPKSLFNKYLIFGLLLCHGVAGAQSECRKIEATIEILQSSENMEKGSIRMDFHGQSKSLFEITILGGKGFSKKDIQEQEVKNLDQGRYIIVFSPKREEDGFCLKHIEFTVK